MNNMSQELESKESLDEITLYEGVIMGILTICKYFLLPLTILPFIFVFFMWLFSLLPKLGGHNKLNESYVKLYEKLNEKYYQLYPALGNDKSDKEDLPFPIVSGIALSIAAVISVCTVLSLKFGWIVFAICGVCILIVTGIIVGLCMEENGNSIW